MACEACARLPVSLYSGAREAVVLTLVRVLEAREKARPAFPKNNA